VSSHATKLLYSPRVTDDKIDAKLLKSHLVYGMHLFLCVKLSSRLLNHLISYIFVESWNLLSIVTK